MLFPAICFLVIGFLAGLVFGGIEGSVVVERRAKGGPKLKHGWLLLGRVALCALVGVMVDGYTTTASLGAGIAFIGLVTAHRRELNHVIGKPYWYMGPMERTPGDSVYDTLLWSVAKWWASVCRKPVAPNDAYRVATVLELSALVALFWGFFSQSA